MSEQRNGIDATTSIEIVFDEVHRQLDAQANLFSSLNTRISFVLTTATVLITFGFGGLAGIVSLWASEPSEPSEPSQAPVGTPTASGSPPPGGNSPGAANSGRSEPIIDASWMDAVSLTIYLLLVLSALIASWQSSKREFDPRRLTKYVDEPEDYTGRRLVGTMLLLYSTNESPLQRKYFFVVLAHGLLFIEVLWMTFTVAVRVSW